jgi:hypothetical protein
MFAGPEAVRELPEQRGRRVKVQVDRLVAIDVSTASHLGRNLVDVGHYPW